MKTKNPNRTSKTLGKLSYLFVFLIIAVIIQILIGTHLIGGFFLGELIEIPIILPLPLEISIYFLLELFLFGSFVSLLVKKYQLKILFGLIIGLFPLITSFIYLGELSILVDSFLFFLLKFASLIYLVITIKNLKKEITKSTDPNIFILKVKRISKLIVLASSISFILLVAVLTYDFFSCSQNTSEIALTCNERLRWPALILKIGFLSLAIIGLPLFAITKLLGWRMSRQKGNGKR